MAECQGVTDTVADDLTEVILLKGGTVRDIACLCAFAKERCQGEVLSGSVVQSYGVGGCGDGEE